MTSTATASSFSAPAEREVLAAVRANGVAARAVEVERAELVLAWVRESVVDPEETTQDAVFDPDVHVGVPGTEQPMRLAGEGAPWVADLGFTRLAAALGQSNEAAMNYVGAVVELAYRLPVLWSRVRAGQVSVHRARTVARLSKKLPAAGAAWVDAQVAWTIGTCSVAQIERTVAAAVARFDPDQAEKDREAALEGRRVDIDLDQVATATDPSAGAVITFGGGLDLADALDLEAAISARAAALTALMPGASEDVRRSVALGDLARGHTSLARATGDDDRASDSGDPNGRTVLLYLHLAAGDLTHDGSGVGRCENTRSPITAEQVRTWCATAGRVLVRPVIDLNTDYAATTYEASPRLREQVILRDGTCRFPFCHRSARAGDLDHIDPHEDGGPTTSTNLAALCRRHHRAKTHAGWTYQVITPGTYHWASPDGAAYLVTPAGTFDLPGSPGTAATSTARVRQRALDSMRTAAKAMPSVLPAGSHQQHAVPAAPVAPTRHPSDHPAPDPADHHRRRGHRHVQGTPRT
ncbi:HNH endonuclease [Ruania suaedae]|uniref:HNH endonuclease n=1 Tax=Ruania suaedae TaxID=2897774 RepID=UPI001E611765|nr:HNH endonuclease signature motif containing protein [Ruania suaedae]UFU04547.1 HNH endonuclease [Ruania suaedae]